MVLCYAFDSGLLPDSFLALYLATTFLGIFNVGLFSQLSFHFLYKKATFIKWQYKSNAEFPKAKLVRHEAVRTIQGIFFSAIFPALAIYLAKKKAGGYGASDSDQGADSFLESKVLPKFQGYCGIDSSGEGMIRHLAEMLFIILVTDVYEWLYHNLGHELDFLWRFHTHHHKFFNPTPWAVIADEPPDQIMRSLPLLVLPFVFRMNVDVLFFTFAAFFYVYGIYLHSGYECDWIVRSDNPVVNTSFQHYMHHYAGGRKHACHTGFFFKFEDWVVGSYYKGDLTMEAQRPYYAINCRKGGKRKYADWERVAKKFPNYSVMYDWRFWLGEIGVKRYEEYFDREEVSVVDLTKAGGYSKEKEIDRVRKHVEGAVVE
uniref:Fatty acid hydroxylase domain-containing protein n=1 Tax=Chromera velia CCMP2878 TaxID=1169474 RepID=A0A0G4G417_9ALVE|eukprot:Cvel_20028.t1-p1 / transcript=Cvel_20028.t1 / gene=Cvel_20028 / organism=Chromera_velia_CCMP2878 / gene_product=C-5 sterol desaturase, putative / transcript_product=C-5 sterol desaturase, putative / location=Cvel_scaffold1768:30262-31377(+) / protein_length=372 / sequence_SO=supercontig / SO=protein_coding / is_pseudo=false